MKLEEKSLVSFDFIGTDNAIFCSHLFIQKLLLHKKTVSHVRNSRALTGEKPCINKAIHALLMHGYATFNMLVPGPQNCCL